MVVYGFFHGGDPRDFRPDAECCSARELEAHAAACKLWNESMARGIKPTPEACQSGWRTLEDGTLIHVLASPYGIGTYSYPDEDEPPDDPDEWVEPGPESWGPAVDQLWFAFERVEEADEDESPAWCDSITSGELVAC